MIAAQGDELLADGTSTIGLALAAFRVRDDALHLVAARHAAVDVAALTSMQQRVDAALNGTLARVLWTLLSLAAVTILVKAQTQLVHLVVVAVLVKAWHTHVEVL